MDRRPRARLHAGRPPGRGPVVAGPSWSGTWCRWARRSGRPTPRPSPTSRPPRWPGSSTATACCPSATSPTWRTVTGGARRYVDAIVAPLTGSGRLRLSSPVESGRPGPTTGWRCGSGAGRAETFDHVVLATHSDQALRAPRGPDRRPRRRCWGPSPTSPTGPCCTPTPRSCRAAGGPGRPGTTTASAAEGRAVATLTYDMNRLQSPPHDHPGAGHLEPDRADRPGPGAGPLRLRPPGARRPGGGRPGGATRRSAGSTGCGTAAPTGATASTRTACRARARPACRRPGRADGGRERPLRGLGGPPPARAGRAPLHPAGAHAPVRPGRGGRGVRRLTRCGRTAGRPRCAFRRRDYLGDRPTSRSTRRCGTWWPSAPGTGPADRSALLALPRTWGWLFNPISCYFCFDEAGQRSRPWWPR